MKLPMGKHPTLCKISCFPKRNKVPITSRCLVKFIVGGDIIDEVWCDHVYGCHIFIQKAAFIL